MHIIRSFENDVIRKKKMVAEIVVSLFRASLVVEETHGEVERERGIKLVDDVFVAFFSAFTLSLHCLYVRSNPAFRSSSAIFRYGTSFQTVPTSCAWMLRSLQT